MSRKLHFPKDPIVPKRAGGRSLRPESTAPGLRPHPTLRRRLPTIAFDELMWRLDQRRLERLIARTKVPR